MLSDVIKKYGGEKMDPLDVYKDIFRIGEGFIQKEYEDSGSFKANPIAYYKNENEDHGHFRIMFEDKFEEIYQNELVNADFCVMNGLTYFGAKYNVMIEILNSLLRNPNYKLVSCNDLNHPYWDGYDDAFVLTIDSDMTIWVQAAKCNEDTYIYTDTTDIVFVHGDVNSSFVKQNKDSKCIMREFNITEIDESEDDYEDDGSLEDAKVTYKVNGKKVSKDEYDQAIKKFDEDWDDINKSINLHHNKYSDNKYSLRKKPYFTGSIDDIASLLWWDLFKC